MPLPLLPAEPVREPASFHAGAGCHLSRQSRVCTHIPSYSTPSFLLLLQICIALRTFAGRISLSARALATRGKITPIGKKRYAGGFLLMSLAIYTYLCACLPRWLVSCMHCGPGLMSCCAFACSLETRRVKRGFRLCVRVCRVCLVCVRVVSAVSRTGTFVRYAQACRCCWSTGEIWKRNETKRLRESQRAMIRHD